jgi:hypothetical protein
MGTKFKLRTAAIASQSKHQVVFEGLVQLHGGDVDSAKLCLEGVVDILGTINARINAGKPIFTDGMDARKQRLLLGIIAGAKVLMDHPEAAEAHNFTPSRLRQAIQQADLDTNAAKAMTTVAASAPTAVSELVNIIHQYTTALESGDAAGINSAKAVFQKLWMYWQRNADGAVAAQ